MASGTHGCIGYIRPTLGVGVGLYIRPTPMLGEANGSIIKYYAIHHEIQSSFRAYIFRYKVSGYPVSEKIAG